MKKFILKSMAVMALAFSLLGPALADDKIMVEIKANRLLQELRDQNAEAAGKHIKKLTIDLSWVNLPIDRISVDIMFLDKSFSPATLQGMIDNAKVIGSASATGKVIIFEQFDLPGIKDYDPTKGHILFAKIVATDEGRFWNDDFVTYRQISTEKVAREISVAFDYSVFNFYLDNLEYKAKNATSEEFLAEQRIVVAAINKVMQVLQENNTDNLSHMARRSVELLNRHARDVDQVLLNEILDYEKFKNGSGISANEVVKKSFQLMEERLAKELRIIDDTATLEGGAISELSGQRILHIIDRR